MSYLDDLAAQYDIKRSAGETDEELRARCALMLNATQGSKSHMLGRLHGRHRGGSFELIEHVTVSARLTRWELVKAFFLGKRFVYPKPLRATGTFAVLVWGGGLTVQDAEEIRQTVNEYRAVGTVAQIWLNGTMV